MVIAIILIERQESTTPLERIFNLYTTRLSLFAYSMYRLLCKRQVNHYLCFPRMYFLITRQPALLQRGFCDLSNLLVTRWDEAIVRSLLVSKDSCRGCATICGSLGVTNVKYLSFLSDNPYQIASP